MKSKIILGAFLALLICSTSLAQTNSKEATIKTKIYCDHCAVCETCSARIEHELNFVKGVKSFKLDVEKQEIKVTYNPAKTDLNKIREAINKSGYDADDKIADTKFTSKLDDCCKKVQ